MHRYIVTGLIGYCIFGLWNWIAISEEVDAPNADQARDAVLARHQGIARQQDPYATVAWEETPAVARVAALAWEA